MLIFKQISPSGPGRTECKALWPSHRGACSRSRRPEKAPGQIYTWYTASHLWFITKSWKRNKKTQLQCLFQSHDRNQPSENHEGHELHCVVFRQYLQWETGETRYMTGQVKDFWTAVAAEQVSSVQTDGTKIFTLHLFRFYIFRFLFDRAAKIWHSLFAPLQISSCLALRVKFILQLQTTVLTCFGVQIQLRHHGLLCVWIQIKGFRINFLVVWSGIEQDVWLIGVRVTVKAWVLFWFIKRRAFGKEWLGPGRECSFFFYLQHIVFNRTESKLPTEKSQIKSVTKCWVFISVKSLVCVCVPVEDSLKTWPVDFGRAVAPDTPQAVNRIRTQSGSSDAPDWPQQQKSYPESSELLGEHCKNNSIPHGFSPAAQHESCQNLREHQWDHFWSEGNS